MVIGVIFGLVLLSVFLLYYLSARRKKVIIKNMSLAVDIVKVGLFAFSRNVKRLIEYYNDLIL